MSKRPARRMLSTRRFQQLVMVFVACTIIVLLIVVYFSFSKTVILVTPAVQSVPSRVQLSLGPAAAADNTNAAQPDLSGRILTKELSVENTFTDVAAATEEPAMAGGTVTIYNKWSKNQPLRAGTRLLSDGGVLFRTTDFVDVPSGSSVTVQVLADQPGKDGEIGPSHFAIVALWEGLKQSIYGESTAAMTGGTVKKARVTDMDLQKAHVALLAKLTSAASDELQRALDAEADKGLTILAIQKEVLNEEIGVKAGDETNAITSTVKANVTGIAVSNDMFDAALQTAAAQALKTEDRILSVEAKKDGMTVSESDAEQQTATLEVQATARTVVRLSNPMFDRTQLLNRDRQEIAAHFSQFDGIAKTEVRFSPFWVIRSPSLPDHIEIKLLDPVE